MQGLQHHCQPCACCWRCQYRHVVVSPLASLHKKTNVGNNLKGVLSANTVAQQICVLKRLGVEVVSVPVASNFAGAHIPTRMVSA